MSIINQALTEAKFRINKRVLDLVFVDPMTRYRQTPRSVDSQIMDLVIKPRVMTGLNAIGGVEIEIPTIGIPREDFNNYESILRIPKSVTNGRSILSVLSITYIGPTVGYQYRDATMCGRSSILQGAEALLNSQADIPVMSTHYVTLIGENVVLVRGGSVLPDNAALRCVLAYDDQLSNFSFRSMMQLAKLFELAIKSYIHLTLETELDLGYLHGGVQMDTIRGIVDRYADAEEMYQEYLKDVMSKVTYMQDHESMSRYTRLLIGAGYK